MRATLAMKSPPGCPTSVALKLLPVTALALLSVGATEGACADDGRIAGAVKAVVGPVTVGRVATTRHVKAGDLLLWRDVVESGKGGTAQLVLGGKMTVTVRELSRLELREDRRVEGSRYIVELVAGKVRVSVARMLMRQGEQVEVRTRTAVASVRGTDFIVEAPEGSAHAAAFGLLQVRELAHGVDDRVAPSEGTLVTTLSGLVEVSNRLAGPGRAEAVGTREAVRVSGRRDPTRITIGGDFPAVAGGKDR